MENELREYLMKALLSTSFHLQEQNLGTVNVRNNNGQLEHCYQGQIHIEKLAHNLAIILVMKAELDKRKQVVELSKTETVTKETVKSWIQESIAAHTRSGLTK